MAKALCQVFLATTVLSLSGCGTFTDMMWGPRTPRIYPGVQTDVDAIVQNHSFLLAADIPLSAAADTILMPLWLTARLRREMELQERHPSTEKLTSIGASTDSNGAASDR
jgi:uncharacterized protein YceK